MMLRRAGEKVCLCRKKAWDRPGGLGLKRQNAKKLLLCITYR